MTTEKPFRPYASSTEKESDRSPAGLRALAERIEAKADTGFCVPGSAVGIYAEAMRALAREREVQR